MRLGLGYEGTSVVRCGWAKISSRLVTATGLGAWGGGGKFFPDPSDLNVCGSQTAATLASYLIIGDIL